MPTKRTGLSSSYAYGLGAIQTLDSAKRQIRSIRGEKVLKAIRNSGRTACEYCVAGTLKYGLRIFLKDVRIKVGLMRLELAWVRKERIVGDHYLGWVLSNRFKIYSFKYRIIDQEGIDNDVVCAMQPFGKKKDMAIHRVRDEQYGLIRRC